LCREVRGEGLRENLLGHALPVVDDDDLDESPGRTSARVDVPRAAGRPPPPPSPPTTPPNPRAAPAEGSTFRAATVIAPPPGIASAEFRQRFSSAKYSSSASASQSHKSGAISVRTVMLGGK